MLLRTDTSAEAQTAKQIPNRLPGAGILKELIAAEKTADWFSEPEAEYTALLVQKDCPAPDGFQWVPFRIIFAEKMPFAATAARAKGLLHWRVRTRFCAACGSPLQDDREETARNCPSCGAVFYPRISPAIIVIVSKGDKILLAKHVQRSINFTCLAGFLETGESAEQCVAREIKEETGIEVQNIQYVTSQSWPFPDQFMMAFRAEYKSGELNLQQSEILEAGWFSRDNLPEIPPEGSVAYNLIMDTW